MRISSLIRLTACALLAGALVCLPVVSRASAPPPPAGPANPAALISEARKIAIGNSPRLMQLLKQLHGREDELSREQHWQLRYLDAGHNYFIGNYDEALSTFKAIIEHSGNPSLVASATALQINILSFRHQYLEAYTLANKLLGMLPTLSDPYARRLAISQISWMMDTAGQHDLALSYARMLVKEVPPGVSTCFAYSTELNVKSGSDMLTSTDPELHKAIALCLKEKRDVNANTLRLDLANVLRGEGHPRQSLSVLQRIQPSILRAGYLPHIASFQAELALTYLSLGDDKRARSAALTALKESREVKATWTMQTAYKVLYQVEKKLGNAPAALKYFEKYVAEDKSSMDDTKARALAYQMVKQDVLSRKLKLEELSKQNKILQLRQSLDRKSAETSRLYILLLMMGLAFIAFWTYRIKHSQLRFRKMAREDDLTGAFNRQHFFEQCERTLERLKKTGGHACLLILDLDHFKRINDIHGHVAGDAVLEHASNIFRHGQRTSDIFGRLGGEEFAILMPGCTREQGAVIGNRMRAILAQSPTVIDEQTRIMVTISIGLASTEVCGYTLRPLLINADAALYEAKDEGRNRLVIGTDDITRSFA